jgi:murein DD-endopeptidase MepM/ murein hydrolase activator NlpD
MRRMGLAAVLCILQVLAMTQSAHADLGSELVEVSERIDRIRSQVSTARDQRTDMVNEVLDTAARLEELVGDLDAAQLQIEQTRAAIADAETEIVILTEAIRAGEAVLAEMRIDMARVEDSARRGAAEIYMAAQRGPSLSLLATRDAEAVLVGQVYAERVQEEALRGVRTLERLRAEEQRRVAAIEEARVELDQQVASLQEERAAQEQEAQTLQAMSDEVRAQLNAQQALLDQLDWEIAYFENELVALEAEEENLRVLIALEQSGGGDAPGVLAWPVSGPIVSPFGYRVHPIYGDVRMHTGVDIDAACGVPIIAASGGRVFLADWKGGYGLTVMIDHGGGMSTLYGHMSATAVSYGQQVSVGEVIGYIGTTGVSTGCHLHFEVRIFGDPVDPAPYL